MQRVYYPSTGFLPVSDEILRLEDECKIRFLQFFISLLSSFPFKKFVRPFKLRCLRIFEVSYTRIFKDEYFD